MKLKSIFILFLIILGSLASSAQNIEFAKMFGTSSFNYGRDVIQTADTGYFVLGNTAGTSGNSDIYLIKTDSLGNMKWQKTIGGNEIEWGNDLKKTIDNGYIIAGYTNRVIASGYDVLLVKIDSLGNEIWSKEYGGVDWDMGFSVIQTPDSGFVVVGETYSSAKSSSNIFMVRTKPNGDTLWTKIIGGSGQDVANAITLCNDSNYVVAGYTTSKGAGGADFYILKINQNGDTLWTKTNGGIFDEKANDVVTTLEGGYMVAGYSSSHDLTHDMADLYKIDASGDSIWEVFYSPPNSKSQANGISRTPNNTYLWAGLTYFGPGNGKDMYYFKMDASANYLVASTVGGTMEDEAFAINQTSDGGIIIIGNTSSFGPFSTSVFLVKCNKGGIPPAYYSINENDENKNEVLVFPNPVKENLNIIIQNKFQNSQTPYHFVIKDLLGKVIFQKDFNFEVENIHFVNGEINQGFYLFSISKGNNVLRQGKLLFE